MSMSDSDSSTTGSDYKNFRQISRERLLYEMLRSAKGKDSKNTWKVLIMDKFTVKIMSYSCKMADITEEGVSLVEDLYKRRQPLPSMDSIYFIQPLKENVDKFLSDMSGRSPLYKKAYVFFSSPISKDMVNYIKRDTSVLPRIGALSEMNLEYFAIDSQGFITDHERALEELFAENAEVSPEYNACINTMATRIATVFASLKDRLSQTVTQEEIQEKDILSRALVVPEYPGRVRGKGFGVSHKDYYPKAKRPKKATTQEVARLEEKVKTLSAQVEYLLKENAKDKARTPTDKQTDHEGPSANDSCTVANRHDIPVEFPYVRYRAAKSCLDASTITTLRDLVPTKIAAGVWNCLAKYKASISDFPSRETCQLLIVDRSIDQIAPVIHEWTYDAMCHDLLNIEGNKYVQEIPSRTGSATEKKEVLLEDHDPIWLELRHAHIADASERLHEKMTNFLSKNKAAQIHHISRDGGELSTRDLQKMVQALPQYSDQIDKLSLHVEIAGKINKVIRELALREVGQLEQDLVFGDAGTKEVINFLRTKQDISPESKMRLLMIYAAIYPEKFEGDKGSKLMQLARLSSDDMNAVNNMKYLAGSDTKKASGSVFSLKFDVHKKKHAARKERNNEEETWQLSRFYPMIEELIEKLGKGDLSKSEYPCINDPSPTFHATQQSASIRTSQSQPALSMRSRRPTWARPRSSDDGYSSDSVLRHASSDFKKMGQRIFVFIVGGATRSELRAVHKLSSKMKREIILGSTSLDDPPQFITKLKLLTAQELSLDDLQI